ncbi:MAG: efflux RND transporter periplasmic adaptor subunit [bacterium]
MGKINNTIKKFSLIFKKIPTLINKTWYWLLIIFILGYWLGEIDTDNTQKIAHQPRHTEAESTRKAEIWTCSMHPQIRLPEPGQCPICFMDLIPLKTESSEAGETELVMSAAARKLAEIETVAVKRGIAKSELRLSGKVEYDETRVKRITAWAGGRLERLYVDFTGKSIIKGAPLVEIYSPTLYAAQEEYLQTLKQSAKTDDEMTRKMIRATREAAREKLVQLGLSQQQIERLEKRATAVDRITINSPISGIVTHKNAEEGMYVKKGTPIYQIADLNKVWVVLDAFESDLPHIRPGQKVSLQVEALPGQIFSSNIDFIDPVLNQKTRSVRVRMSLDNQAGNLKPGMFVNGIVLSEIRKDKDGKRPLLIPASAVLKTGTRAVVYVERKEEEKVIYEGREIELGVKAGDYYVVTSGLKAGEKVVVKGNFKIDSAMQITAKPSMMNPPELSETDSVSHSTDQSPPPEPDQIFLDSLTPVYQAYFKIQTALKDDNFNQALDGLRQLGENLKKADQHVTGDNQKWMEYKSGLKEILQHIDHFQSLAKVRKAFADISIQIINVQKQFGHTEKKTYYEIFCPMAFDNKGAYWLQSSEQINNPYFGAKMLSCGEIKSELKPNIRE